MQSHLCKNVRIPVMQSQHCKDVRISAMQRQHCKDVTIPAMQSHPCKDITISAMPVARASQRQALPGSQAEARPPTGNNPMIFESSAYKLKGSEPAGDSPLPT
eukprot:1154903-Pelagomonas_calceolata.AAC.5